MGEVVVRTAPRDITDYERLYSMLETGGYNGSAPEVVEVGDYWLSRPDSNALGVWCIRTYTTTVIRHCVKDAVITAENAIKTAHLRQHQEGQTFQSQLEGFFETMVEYYDADSDIASDIAMWANDWAAYREREARQRLW